MWRNLHSLPGLIGMVLLLALTISGAMLSIYPALDSIGPEVQSAPELSVGDLAGNAALQIPNIDHIVRNPSGTIVVHYLESGGSLAQAYINALTGEILHPVDGAGATYQWLKKFHRSMLMGENGRIVAGLGAVLMILICLSGAMLMVTRMGGVSRIFDKPKGNWSQRFHTILTRLVIIPLLFSALTGTYMVLAEFEILPNTQAESQAFPVSAPLENGSGPTAPGSLHALAEIPLDRLISLKFPMADDPQDVYTLTTQDGLDLIDRNSGDVLEHVPATVSQTIYNWLYALHTGEGVAWFGLLSGMASILVPILGITGTVIWWNRIRGSSQKIPGNQPPENSEIIVLVGSEGGSTWGFARSLHRDLTQAGKSVHVAAMNDFSNNYDKALFVIFLTSTYGNGSAPQSASQFHTILADMPDTPNWKYAVLGFGDRAFPQYCQYAKDLDTDIANHGWMRCLETSFINRQSTQAFSNWGNELAAAINCELHLSHRIELPRLRKMHLVEKAIYGEKIQAPTAVLRFETAGQSQSTLWQKLIGQDGHRPRFLPGDLLGILPPGSETPRYYSIASGPSDTEVEICVKKQVNGECSTFLAELTVGEEIECFVRSNPDFAITAGNKPVIMIGAGTGIAPFMGMIRANRTKRPIQLFWGGRDPQSDFLYQSELLKGQQEHRLAGLTTAFSRVAERQYVQDKVRDESATIAEHVRRGASIMVCGGDAMAKAVRLELEKILAPLGLSVAQLIKNELYAEDIF